MRRFKFRNFKMTGTHILFTFLALAWAFGPVHAQDKATDRGLAGSSSAVIEVYSGNGSVFSKYSLSMQKNLWGLKAEYQSKMAETNMSANDAFSVQSRIFDLSMRDPKKNQKCKLVAKITTTIGDSLLCEEDARSMGKFKVLIGEMNKVLANRGKKLKNTH